MATKPRYKTKSNNYTTQKDYAKLKKLLDDGAYVVCFVDYEPHSTEKYTFQQIALAHKDDFYEISAHGISYMTWWDGLEFSFEDLCELNNVEFIEPTTQRANLQKSRTKNINIKRQSKCQTYSTIPKHSRRALTRKSKAAVEFLQKAEKLALKMQPSHGFWLAFSGGKDSCVILELARMAGVKFTA